MAAHALPRKLLVRLKSVANEETYQLMVESRKLIRVLKIAKTILKRKGQQSLACKTSRQLTLIKAVLSNILKGLVFR